MIAKERTIPLKIQVGEALKRRLPKNHLFKKELEEELARRWAGYWGEQSIDHHLSLLDEKKYLIFHDLNLPWLDYTFQIDTLLLSSHFALILEVKNMSGILFFDQNFKQLIRTTSDGKEEGFGDPIGQAEHHELQLKRFFKEKRLPKVPFESAVVVSNKHSILRTNPGQTKIFQNVFKSPHIIRRVQELEMMYSKEVLSSKELNKIRKTLINCNTQIGGASAGIAVEELKNIGVKAMIRIGSCGANQPDIRLGDLVIAAGAVRNDGASDAYMERSYPAVPDTELLFSVIETAKKEGYSHHIGLVRSHDSFYTDEEQQIDNYWSSKGILASDMETAPLFVIGRLRGIKTASILNVVVEQEGNLEGGINDYLEGENDSKRGEEREILTALEAIVAYDLQK